ncbi:MAG: preprotein translocase subunit SecE [Gammaproteobacteria bacterium]|nr:preprotein translocase subunit SecE [Gammaproteobacteria bacterium]
MSVKPEIQGSGSPLDTAVLIVALLIMGGGFAGFYYLPDIPEVVAWAGGFLDVIRWLFVIAMAVLAGLVAYQTQLGKSTWLFFQGSKVELRKVVWPTGQETLQTTLFVLLAVAFLGVILWGLDAALLWGTKQLTGQGG